MLEGASLLNPSEPRSASGLATSVAIAALSSTHGVNRALEIECLRDQLAVVGRVAESHLRRLRALEVEVHVVLHVNPIPPCTWIPSPATFRYASDTYALAIDDARDRSGASASTAHAA